MKEITIYEEQHGNQSPHYHILGVRPKVFYDKMCSMIADKLPDGYERSNMPFADNIHVVVKGSFKCAFHIDYSNVLRGPMQGHAFHIYVNDDRFKPLLTEMIKKCYPRSEVEVEWIEMEEVN